MHAMGWAQSSYYAQVRALAAGHTEIDSVKWQAKDEAWVDGHFYSVKAPGLAALTLPAYLALDAVNASSAARAAAGNAHATAHDHWHSHAPPKYFGFSVERAASGPEGGGPADADRLGADPVRGGAPRDRLAAVRPLGGGAGRAPGSVPPPRDPGAGDDRHDLRREYLSHVVSAALGFGAFALLMRERRGSSAGRAGGDRRTDGGPAVCFEYPLACSRPFSSATRVARAATVRRAISFGAAAALGPRRRCFTTSGRWVAASLRLLLRRLRPRAQRPRRAGAELERLLRHHRAATGSGDRPAALRSRGSDPDAGAGHGRGGRRADGRRGWRAEATVIGAVAALYFLYNAGYWQPLGGGTPGPRFLTPALPFVALGLAPAYRRFPALTLGLAIPSAVTMLAAALTYPLLGDGGTGTWIELAGRRQPRAHPADGLRSHQRLARGAAGARCGRGRDRVRGPGHPARYRSAGCARALWAVLAWSLVSIVGPTIAGDPGDSPERRVGGAGAGWRGGGCVSRHPDGAPPARPAPGSPREPGQSRAEPRTGHVGDRRWRR